MQWILGQKHGTDYKSHFFIGEYASQKACNMVRPYESINALGTELYCTESFEWDTDILLVQKDSTEHCKHDIVVTFSGEKRTLALFGVRKGAEIYEH